MGPIIVIAATFLLMWLLFILPQQRRIRAHQAFVATLAEGDEVITTSGIHGTVTAVDGEDVSLEIAPGTVVRIARGAIAARPSDEPARPAGTAADRAAEAIEADDPIDQPTAET